MSSQSLSRRWHLTVIMRAFSRGGNKALQIKPTNKHLFPPSSLPASIKLPRTRPVPPTMHQIMAVIRLVDKPAAQLRIYILSLHSRLNSVSQSSTAGHLLLAPKNIICPRDAHLIRFRQATYPYYLTLWSRNESSVTLDVTPIVHHHIFAV